MAAERRRKMGMRRKKVEEEVKKQFLTFLEFYRWGLGGGRQQRRSLGGSLQGDQRSLTNDHDG